MHDTMKDRLNKLGEHLDKLKADLAKHQQELVLYMPRQPGRASLLEMLRQKTMLVSLELPKDEFISLAGQSRFYESMLGQITEITRLPDLPAELRGGFYSSPVAPWGKRGKRINPGEAYQQAKRKSKKAK